MRELENKKNQTETSGNDSEPFNNDDYRAEVVADSISPEEIRLTSVEVTMARFVLAELNTHRMFSRNSASSRAIPVEKQLLRILKKPYLPQEWGQNATGMSSKESLSAEETEVANRIWLTARDCMAAYSNRLSGGTENVKSPELQDILRDNDLNKDYGEDTLEDSRVHKQFVNRLLEPFMYHTVLITATEWDNFFALRINEAAQPEIRRAAELIKRAIDESLPRETDYDEWHMPYIDASLHRIFKPESLKKVSTARAARLSYLNQQKHQQSLTEGKPIEEIIDEDIRLHNRLVTSGHMSPLEHVATPFTKSDWQTINRLKMMISTNHYLNDQLEFHGNFKGWHQYRKDMPHEDDFSYQNAA